MLYTTKLFRNKLFLLLLLIQTCVLLFYASNLANEKYSYIGDEFNTYVYAKQIALGEINPSPFSLYGVFGENPVLGSYYQAAVMKLFGTDIYGWKLSSLLVIFPLGLLMFYLAKKLSTLQIAFFALFATDFSFYFYNFFQIGYLNNLSLLLLVCILYLATFLEKKSKKQSHIPYLLLGITVGISWYFYIGKLFVFIVGIYLLLTNKWNKTFLRHFLSFILPALLLIGISFVTAASNQSDLGLAKTILHKEFNDNTIILKNIFYPFVLHFYSPMQTHYIPEKKYVDFITAGLATIGFLVLLFSLLVKKFRLYRQFYTYLLLFLLTCFFVGITVPYSNPPITRGIHFVPFYILFAAFGLFFLTSFISKFKTLIIFVITIVVVILNLISITKPLPAHTNQKLLSYLQNQESTNVVLIKSKNCINLVNLNTAIRSYNLPHKVFLLENMDKKYCRPSNIIMSCIPDICNKKPEKIFEKRLFIYKP